MEKWKAEREARLARGEKEEEEEEEEEINIYAVTEEEVLGGQRGSPWHSTVLCSLSEACASGGLGGVVGKNVSLQTRGHCQSPGLPLPPAVASASPGR